MMSLFESPYPPYDPTDKAGFSYETVVKRWPVIITGVIDQLHRECHRLTLESQQFDVTTPASNSLEDKIMEGTRIIEKISKLKYQMGRDHPLDDISNDGEALVEVYNDELKRLLMIGKNTWYTAPWLFAECYLYRLLRSYFSVTTHWSKFDPFQSQKWATFAQSGKSIQELAVGMDELESDKDNLDETRLAVLFGEMVQMCLWGNATDLSLLTHMSASDIEHLQSVGKDAQAARLQFILKDDLDQLWNHVKSLEASRIDFVLDNAGFELFTDFVFADFLVTYTPYVSEVYFHPKLIPWFVSDVTPQDFKQTITSLSDPTFFTTSSEGPALSHSSRLQNMVRRWRRYIDEGKFKLSVPLDTGLGSSVTLAEFWTGPQPYWNMEIHAPELFKTLKRSQLVIFKGDLNYRKLTGDVRWPAWTPFEVAIGPLAGSFPIVSLRTNKAEVVVGVDKETAEKLDSSGERWRTDGRRVEQRILKSSSTYFIRYALISFLKSRS